MIKMSQNHLTGKVSNSNLLKPLAATTTWLSAEENTSVSIDNSCSHFTGN